MLNVGYEYTIIYIIYYINIYNIYYTLVFSIQYSVNLVNSVDLRYITH